MLAVSVQIGTSGVPDEQRIAGQDEPRLVAARVVGDKVGIVRRGVAGSGERLDLGVAELDDLAIRERMVLEVHAGALGEIGGRARAGGELRKTGDVVGLHVRVEHGNDRRALAVGQRDVLIDQIDVRVDDRKRAVGLATEQVGGARGLVVQQLTQVHA